MSVTPFDFEQPDQAAGKEAVPHERGLLCTSRPHLPLAAFAPLSSACSLLNASTKPRQGLSPREGAGRCQPS